VSYLPFAFDPQVAFREALSTEAERDEFASDVLFAGGADADRVPYIAALIEAGLRVLLYGDYWHRFPETRSCTRGQATAQTLRKAAAGAKVALCLVRRANRDGHVMRSFEIPATGACMLAEDTDEHREIFGKEGRTALYFRGVDEMVEKARWLREHDDDRKRMAAAAHELIAGGHNTYRDRLVTMLQLEHPNQHYPDSA
jgi:spore maturation protein CgeB